MKSMCFITKSCSFFETRIKNKKVLRILEFDQPKWIKPYFQFNTQRKIEAEKNGSKSGKASYKLMNKAVYGKTMENLRNRVDVRLVNIEKDYVK